MTSTFAAGEVYSKTGAVDKVGRIYGSGIGSAKVTPGRCFAYEGQLVNGQLQKEKLDAYGLMTAEKLSGSSAKIGWSRRIGIGSGFRLTPTLSGSASIISFSSVPFSNPAVSAG